MVSLKNLPDAPRLHRYLRDKRYPRRQELEQAEKDYRDLRDLHDESVLSIILSRDFWNLSIPVGAKVIGEILTGKRLKSAQAKLQQEEMLFAAANRMYQLTGCVPGEISGVVKNEIAANKKSAQHTHNVKIAAAMVLAYSRDAEQKKQVITEIKSKYPELLDDIKNLAKKAKARTKQDAFKAANAGLKFADNKHDTSKNMGGRGSR